MLQQDRSPPRVEPQPRSSPGRMTAVMRAMAASGPRVLRVGVFVEGRIIEERVLPRHATVTVGSSERAMFVVTRDAASIGGPVPEQLRLFERTAHGYVLNVVPGVTGRVATSSGVVDLGAARVIQLDEQARGRVVVGDTTFLFQFVAQPPVQARPQLPLSVKQGLLAQIDWTLTVIAALSFLLHFGLVGGMYSDWGDTVVGDDLTVGLSHIVQPPEAPVVVESVTNAPVDGASTPGTSTAPTPSPTPGPRPVHRSSTPDPSDVAGLEKELARLGIEAIGSMKGGPNLGIVTSRGDAAPVDLDALWNRSTRIDTRSTGLDLPGAGAPIQPGRHDLAQLVAPPSAPIATSAGDVKRVVPVEVHEDAPIVGGSVLDAEAVIRTQIHPGARRCYQMGLGASGQQSGKLMVLLRIAPSGEVQSATVQSNTGLSPQVAACVVSVAHNARFDPPGPNGATILVPFNFLTQGG